VNEAWLLELTTQSIFGNKINWSPRRGTVPVRSVNSVSALLTAVDVGEIPRLVNVAASDALSGAKIALGVPEFALAGNGCSCWLASISIPKRKQEPSHCPFWSSVPWPLIL
jgi:hypothetical protein